MVYTLIILWHCVIQVHYNQSVLIVNSTNFNGTCILGNLRPYNEYSIRVRAMTVIQATGEFLEGVESRVVTERTLAGGTVTYY